MGDGIKNQKIVTKNLNLDNAINIFNEEKEIWKNQKRECKNNLTINLWRL